MVDDGADVLTLGYEEKTLDDVLDELDEHRVERLVDVRAINESQQDGFTGPELADALSQRDIAYVHLGELGDFQPQPYPDYMDTPDWARAYQALLDAIDAGNTALLCRCADASSCHRRYLAKRLREDGYDVVHLTPAGPKQAVTFETGA